MDVRTACGARIRAVAWRCLLVLGCLVTLPAVAQTVPGVSGLQAGDVPDARKHDRVVAILPLRSFDVQSTDLFAPDAPRETATLAGVEQRLADALHRYPSVRVISPADVRTTLTQDTGLAPHQRRLLDRYRAGLEQYLNLATDEAAEALQSAIEAGRTGLQDVIDPKPLADAQVMLGVALLDMKQPVKAHIALREVFVQQPERRFRPNFFSAAVNAEIQKAFVDWRETGDPTRPFGDARRLHVIADKLGADALVYGVVRPTPTGPEAVLFLYDDRRRVVDSEVRAPLTPPAGDVQPLADSGDRVDAFLSRWLSCAPIAESPPDPSTVRHDDGLHLDMSSSYALYLKQPTRQNFHSVGFSVGVNQEFRPGIEWFGRAHLYTSISDPYRDLLHAFNSVRLVGGLGFAWQGGPLRLFIRPGLDAHLLGDFVATTDADCKFFGTSHPLCDKSTVSDLQQRILVGVNVSAGAWLHMGRNFYLAVQSSAAIYFLPLGGTERLNYPIGGDLGLGYAF